MPGKEIPANALKCCQSSYFWNT